AHLVLEPLPEWKLEIGQVLLAQAEEEVALIAPFVDGAQEPVAAVRPLPDAGVVACAQARRQGPGSPQQMAELERAIARRARKRRPPLPVGGDERLDHLGSKGPA